MLTVPFNPCLAKLREGEPFFVLLGRDAQAAGAVEAWAAAREHAEGKSAWTDEAREKAATMRDYRRATKPNEPDLPAAPADGEVVGEIAAERRRQMEIEGWALEHDDKHNHEEMADAAACYAMKRSARRHIVNQYTTDDLLSRLWPWAAEWWKPDTRRRDLIKAGALIVAEIERIDRAALSRLHADRDGGSK
jgi:hypothetical protein